MLLQALSTFGKSWCLHTIRSSNVDELLYEMMKCCAIGQTSYAALVSDLSSRHICSRYIVLWIICSPPLTFLSDNTLVPSRWISIRLEGGGFKPVLGNRGIDWLERERRLVTIVWSTFVHNSIEVQDGNWFELKNNNKSNYKFIHSLAKVTQRPIESLLLVPERDSPSMALPTRGVYEPNNSSWYCRSINLNSTQIVSLPFRPLHLQ